MHHVGKICRSCADDVLIPAEGIFRNTLAGREVNIDKAKAFAIATAPLEVIRQGPLEVTPDIGTVFDGVAQSSQITGQEIDPLQIMDLSIQIDAVVAAETVFGDVSGKTVTLLQKPDTPV